MKNSVNNVTRYFLYLVFAFVAVGLTACSNDDDVTTPAPTGSIEVEDQTISQNQVVLDQIMLSTDGFIIARHATQTGGILAQESVDEGTHDDVVLQLDDEGTGIDLQDGDAVVLTLYADTNANGNFDSTTDVAVDSETIIVTSPGFDADDQAVVDNGFTYTNVSTMNDSFLVAYGENEDGTLNENDVLGSAAVQAGENQEVNLTFDEGRAPAAGTRVQTRLHRDVDADGVFDPATDTTETFGFGTPNTVTRTTNVL